MTVTVPKIVLSPVLIAFVYAMLVIGVISVNCPAVILMILVRITDRFFWKKHFMNTFHNFGIRSWNQFKRTVYLFWPSRLIQTTLCVLVRMTHIFKVKSVIKANVILRILVSMVVNAF